MLPVIRTTSGLRVHTADGWFHAAELTIDALFGAEDAAGLALASAALRVEAPSVTETLAPIGSQEVWAAGVTYLRSRDARVEESGRSGADRLYDLVYQADRPELFFKATPSRVRGHGQPVGIRRDGRWNVPEPELTLALNPHGSVIGFTIGNDMSSRDIEGENPLYLPQAKIYSGSCALGPALVLAPSLPPDTGIHLDVLRSGTPVFHGDTSINRIKRGFAELSDWLFRENEFPQGVYLMTGTGIVPPTEFTLEPGDLVRIAIDGLGILENPVG